MPDDLRNNSLLLGLKNEDLAIAHRQWVRANRVKEYFDSALIRENKNHVNDITRFYLSDSGVFMFLWYSLIYSVIEFLEYKGIDLDSLDDDFENLKNGLRKTRNSIFHAEAKYWDKRQFDLIALPQAGQRIRQVHDTLGSYFLDAMDSKVKP